ncbi:PREDICTED: Ig-like and fibronectin type-III domain-containing protein 2 isoform X1 [Bactrocera latifrons]|uniref:Ig-like and fibronectin type-III domain-containing protein 2 isoform X1 n=1 Tax=Bactrocera latifrons TaxID=174628 RepID=UPI0008DCC4E9|nr:PREDICTED: Ig-like and fibronectin type-III domain-containing protein 2 isoform X1 [Bactrocera latifrons]
MEIMFKLLVVLTTSTCLFSTVNSGVPIATGGPSLIYEGKDALLTCVVSENRANHTVIWKKSDEILTAGMVRVTSDTRVSVLHDESEWKKDPKGLESGGEVWVLLVKRLTTEDSGSYICELNSEPVLRSIHILTVKQIPNGNDNITTTTESSDVYLVPPPLDATDNRSFWRAPTVAPQITHDFTECCERANVTAECMGFCNVHNIIDGTTGIEPEACEKDFPNIVRCMADGRDHVPCCVDKQIPDLCQDMCRGEYTPFTDLLKTRVSCVHHTLSGLQCILQGVQNIPSTPTSVTVDHVSETRVTVHWYEPEKLAHKVAYYSVNLTALHSFDEDEVSNAYAWKKRPLEQTIIRTVPVNQTTLTLQDLTPLTMYAIVVTAHNDYGSSLPSERLRVFTHTSEVFAPRNDDAEASASVESIMPELPNIRSCCEAKGMTHRKCLDKMCDPQKTDLATLPDFMVCAPWSNITFTCLANKIDHTPCCRARGIPAVCFPLCSGKISTLDFSLFKCLRFMSEYSSCLFQGYGVLADPPSMIRTVAKADNFIILDWDKPKRLADTISTYHVKFRRLGEGDDYLTVVKKNPPLILEGLEPEVYYEFYVVSVNQYGKSEASPRLITRTQPAEAADEPEPVYNMTKCCQASGLLPQCAPLCSYNIKLSDIEKLGPACRAQMSVIVRCAAGGRDHTPCCQRRGVPTACMTICRGVMPHYANGVGSNAGALSGSSYSGSNGTTSSDCLSYAGNILQCIEEGTESIPGPAEDVHAISVTNTTISLTWRQPGYEASAPTAATTTTTDNEEENTKKSTTPSTAGSANNGENNNNSGNTNDIATAGGSDASTSNSADDIDFIVQYGKVNNMTLYETVAKLENELTTNETSIALTNLEPHALYRIMVVTRGRYGTALPSSMLLINTTDDENVTNKNNTYGAPSPPHSLSITSHSATWMQLTWQPPEYSHPHEKITYRVYHKPMKSEKFNKIETKVAWLRMSNLKPSSQHILYVEAIGEHATSLPSETLVAWTDPALPAFVDPPTVHPADNIPEGGSMTILCLALGNPAPTISLYVGGHLVRQDTSRHMVTVIHNVTADMEHISCYADNGYGVPMQATRRVNICYAPKITAAGITVASLGDEVELRCTVDAKPTPKTIFWRDHDGRVPVIQGGHFDISTKMNESHTNLYTMSLRINKMLATDVGDYFCHAENAFGSATSAVSVRIRTTPALGRNVSECCRQMNVSMACRAACSYYVDIEAIADKPECIVDFDKLMKCAADGSDHRSCCADANVPRKCLNWCRGDSVRSKEICSLQYSRTIVGCFEMNRDKLPGPPENIAVSVMSDNEVMIRWDPPQKNPNVVEGYRIFYHEAAILAGDSSESSGDGMTYNATTLQNTTEIRRLDVKETTVNINGLKKDVLYELVVKAGNSFGASVLTEPVKFTLGDHHVTSATTYSNAVGTISGIVASILAVLLAAAAIVFYRRHRARNGKAGNGVAFENPTYTRGLEQVQLPTVTSAITHAGTTAQLAQRDGIVNDANADAHTQCNEVNPTIYEELKLGQEGAGFKKLVP